MTTKDELKAIRDAERKIYKKMQQTQDWFEGYQEGRAETLKEVEKIIDEWRKPLETGFISIDKHFVDELKQKLKKLR